MRPVVVLALPLAVFLTSAQAAPAAPGAPAPKVAFETTLGKIVIELFPDKAPLSVKNFLQYVDTKFYNGTVFHRVIPGFMIQGGGFTKDLSEKPTRPPIKNEAANGLANKRGTVAMARTNVVDSATAQFFINLANNDFLDHKSPEQFGYAVFGEVAEGMGVVDAIARAERLCPSTDSSPCTANLPPGLRDVPKPPVIILKAYRVK
jgi:peptidyl-prolyl cis-trans isomerase A (cyclophilin A)